jgi:hypothetical protein
MERPGVSAGTGSQGMRCVFEELRGVGLVGSIYRPCGRPGVGMFEQKPYCADHMREVETAHWRTQRTSDQASPED